MPDPALSDEIRQAVRTMFRTIWNLETLLFLHRNADRSWSTSALVKELRSGETAIKDSIERLQVVGLVIETESGCYQYRPANEDLDRLVMTLKQLYAERPYALIAEIASAPSPGIQSFADAFKFRKD
jgi:biotin operon repressor